MAFVPRTFEEIRDDMLAYVRMRTTLTDFEIGSVIRTIVEAAALEDDEQYFQMVQLLDAFRLSSATGQDLDERVAEFNIVRLQPGASTGTVIVQDGNLVTSLIETSYVSGVSLVLEDTSKFPNTGNIRVGEGTTLVEEASFTANNTSTGTLTLALALVNAHDMGTRVSIVSGADRPLTTGIRVQVPAVGTTPSIIFVTTEAGTIVAGNYESTALRGRAEIPGTTGNVGVGKITQFASNPPFDGALVTNKSNFAGGRDIESDADLRDRARASIQALSKGTILALKEGVLGVEDPVTGQRVTTANILEDFVHDEVVVYVDDGTGFTPDQVDLPRTTVASIVSPGGGNIIVDSTEGMPEEGFLIISPEDNQIEILEFSGVNHATNTISLATTAVNGHGIGSEVAVVDMINANAEAGEKFFDLANFPVVRSSYRLWVEQPGTVPPLEVDLQTEDVDYFLNRGPGQIEFITSGVSAGARVVANYSYYTTLLHQVQKVIDGDPDDSVNYPGIRAAGVRVVAETPVIRRVTVRGSISAAPGFQEADLSPTVQESIEAYINGLGIGADVVRAEIIRRAMSVTGVQDFVLTLPLANVVILENELPRPVDVSGNSLVTVN